MMLRRRVKSLLLLLAFVGIFSATAFAAANNNQNTNNAEEAQKSSFSHLMKDHSEYVAIGAGLLLTTILALLSVKRKARTEKKQEEWIRAEIVRKMMGGESVLIVNPRTGEYELIFRKRRNENYYPGKGLYSEALDMYISSDVHRYDREMLRRDAALDQITAGLEHKKEYIVIYRDISSGVSRWYRLRAVMLSETEILLGIGDYDKEFIKDAIREKLEEDSYALFVVNLDNGLIEIAKKSPWDPKWAEGEKAPYADVINSIADKYNGEIQDFYTRLSKLANIKKFFATEDKFSYTYQSKYVENNPWVIITGLVVIRHNDGTPAVCVLNFSLLDPVNIEKAELQDKLTEALSIIKEEKSRTNIISEIIHAGQWLIKFNPDNKVTGIEYFFDDDLQQFKLSIDPQEWGDSIPGEDRELLLGNIRATIADESGQTPFDVTYRMLDKEGNYSYIRSAGKAVRNDDGSGEVFGMLFNVTDRVKNEQLQQEKFKQAEEAQKLISNIAKGYGVVYVVNMADDSVDVQKINEKMIEYGHQFENFTQVREFFCSDVLHPRDRERMETELDYAVIRRRLEEKPSYSVEYATIINGTTYGGEMSVTAIDENKIIIGMAYKDLELTKRHLEEKCYEEYFALFIIDLDTEMIRTFKNQGGYKISTSDKAVPYTQTVQAFADTLSDAEAKEFFRHFADADKIRQELATDDKRSYSYKSDNVGKWVAVTVYVIQRNDDGAPAMVVVGFSLADSLEADRQETQARMKQQMETISGLASEYTALYHVNLDTGEYKPYYVAQKIKDIRPHIERNDKYLGLYNAFIESEMVHPDDRAKLHELYPSDEGLKSKLADKKNISLLFKRNYSGKFLWSEVNIIKCEDIGEPARMVVVGFKEVDRKVREEQENQKQLAAALESAEVANKSKTSFLFNMSHDIRTPMNAINGFTAMAKKYLTDKERVADYLDKIEVSGQQLLALVNQVLEMSRIESGKIELDNKPVNILEEFNSMVIVLAAQASDNGQEFKYTNNITHFNVLADKAKMGQITLNIAGNALKYTPAGGKIDFSLREIPCEKDGWARYVFTVVDTGIGMSKDYLKVLYEPFTREKSSTVSRIQGTGLGMSIVKNLVDFMGGTIEVDSELGRGTRFAITLDFEITSQPVDKEVGNNKAVSVSFEGKRVLLVEDNELNREIAKDILEDVGLAVEEADDGDAAVAMVKAAFERGEHGYYNIILMDIQMPKMDGYEATRAIRALENSQGGHLPIIAMTANAFEEDRKNALAAGMDDHLAKPIEIDKLMATLSQHL